MKSEGWDYLADYSSVTVNHLYDQWRDILSDNEFEQVKLELLKNKTPYDAQLMLAGAFNIDISEK